MNYKKYLNWFRSISLRKWNTSASQNRYEGVLIRRQYLTPSIQESKIDTAEKIDLSGKNIYVSVCDSTLKEAKKLQACLSLPSSSVKLLKYHNNFIQKIERLETLSRLIYLDFTNNHLDEITGLEALRNLKVLLLGQNRIKEIKGINHMMQLDILDLHGNEIEKVGMCQTKDPY